MQSDIVPVPDKDTSISGREEEVITNSEEQKKETNKDDKITNLPAKDQTVHKETEGERRFKEGLANNDEPKEE